MKPWTGVTNAAGVLLSALGVLMLLVLYCLMVPPLLAWGLVDKLRGKP